MDLWDLFTTEVSRTSRRSLNCWEGKDYRGAPWTEVVRDAERMTAGLRRAGVRPGTRVGTLLTNSAAAVRGLLGTWFAGGAVASLPLPARGMAFSEYLAHFDRFADQLGTTAIMVDAALLESLPEEMRARLNVRTWESCYDSGPVELQPPGPDDLAFVQYSSGSTMVPKGCMLTARAISSQISGIIDMVGLRHGDDTCVTWLPMSHDMGLFGTVLTALAHDTDLFLAPPERFMMAPRTWFRDIAATGATVSVGTETALSLAAHWHRPGHPLPGRIQLHTLILGAERNDWNTMSAAVEAFGSDGLTWEAMMPAYGMAEAVLAVTHTPRPERPRYVTVDAGELAGGRVLDVAPEAPHATRIVSAGVPCTGVELLDMHPDQLSELRIRTPSLSAGYYADPGRTGERFDDGVLATRDLAFVRDGYLYPVGRVDDMISVGGRKVYACEIEAAVERLGLVRRGCSTLIETVLGSRPELALLIELRDRKVDVRTIAEGAAQAAMDKGAIVLDRCIFLEKGALPKTPSGKVQRYRCREMLHSGRFTPVDVIELSA